MFQLYFTKLARRSSYTPNNICLAFEIIRQSSLSQQTNLTNLFRFSRWVVVAGAWRASVMRPPAPAAGARNDRHSSLLQLAAWGVPAALAAAVLVTRDVDADELTGRCLQ